MPDSLIYTVKTDLFKSITDFNLAEILIQARLASRVDKGNVIMYNRT
jgi:hypothetical protein